MAIHIFILFFLFIREFCFCDWEEGKRESGSPVVSCMLRGMARDFPRTTPSGFLGSCSPGKLRQTSGRLYSRGAVDGRRPITVGGGGGYLLMGKGKSQIVGSYFIFLSCFLHGFSQEKARRRRPMRLSFREGGDETETFEEAYGDPIPQNLNFLE